MFSPRNSFYRDPFEDYQTRKKNPKIGLFTDAEVEGKKEGYKKAAKKYEESLQLLKIDYDFTIEKLKSKEYQYDKISEYLLDKLKELELEREKLKGYIAKKGNVSKEEIDSAINYSLRTGASLLTSSCIMPQHDPISIIIDCIYAYKERKFREAEKRGYEEAENIYKEKISKLEKKLKCAKEEGNKSIHDIGIFIYDLLTAIRDNYKIIAELKISIDEDK